MSRIRKAAVNAVYGYSQFAIAIVTGIVLVPLTLHHLGVRSWGLWLASGELLGYAGMVDFGILAVLPWMLAEAHGGHDRQRMRRLVGEGVWVGMIVGVVYIGLALLLWRVLPSVLRLTEDERATLAGPLVLLVLVTGMTYPLRVFRAVLGGIQDAHFNGSLSLIQAALTATLTAILLIRGYGLYAIAVAAALPAFTVMVVSAFRVMTVAPDLLRGWGRPSVAALRPLVANGTGVWLGVMGWQLLAASNSLVLAFLGRPEWAVIYACTAKLSATCTQLVWIPTDSGLVGLAQVYGERTGAERLRHLVLMMLRMHLLLSGAAACALLIINPTFVTLWVGGTLFGGVPLNMLLATGVIVYSVVHGLITTAAVLGNRLQVGAIVLVNGLVQVPLAIVLGHRWGLAGIATAGLIAAGITVIPACVLLLRSATALGVDDLVRALLAPWGARAGVLITAATLIGLFHKALSPVVTMALGSALGVAYVWHMRPLYTGLPVHPRWSPWLVRARLLPRPDAALDPV
jgi:O-antigen/teichoic acid export membrane protein